MKTTFQFARGVTATASLLLCLALAACGGGLGSETEELRAAQPASSPMTTQPLPQE